MSKDRCPIAPGKGCQACVDNDTCPVDRDMRRNRRHHVAIMVLTVAGMIVVNLVPPLASIIVGAVTVLALAILAVTA